MKVKIFTANTMQDAMSQVKNTLGRDAVILHTRRFRKGGIGGFFGKEMVEVMAAIDTPLPPLRQEQANTSQVVKKVALSPQLITNQSSENDLKASAMQAELTNMRKMLEQIINTTSKAKHDSPWYSFLRENEIEKEVAEHVLQSLPLENSVISSNNEIVKKLLFDQLCNYFQNIEGINIPATGCKKIALIGTTGVGKTTTLAKLAAHFSLNKGCKIALITADTYRIAAVDQLRTYAEILNIPIEIVYVPEDLKNAFNKHKDKNLILVDTAGRSPSNENQMSELESLLAVDSSIEKHLVLSATTKYKDALVAAKNFSSCYPDKIIFTKLDEVSNIGTIINILHNYPGMPLSYVTTGQNVPDDIELGNAHKLVRQLLRDL